MPREQRKVEEEPQAGAPEWMITFSDCMTLLLTFFVLLLSFAGFSEKTFRGIGNSFGNALSGVGQKQKFEEDSMWRNQQVKHREKLTKGTEVKTLIEEDTGNFMKEDRPLDFRNLKVFTVPSTIVFWGSGSVITKTGREILDAFVIFLKSTPNRVVISENGPDAERTLGLSRAWTVLDYMTTKKGLDKNAFSITASSTIRNPSKVQRMLEITLLERDIYE
jgi:flagellar motor protein MotB